MFHPAIRPHLRRPRTAVFLLTALGLVLAGCSGDDEDSAATDAMETTTEATTGTEEAEGSAEGPVVAAEAEAEAANDGGEQDETAVDGSTGSVGASPAAGGGQSVSDAVIAAPSGRSVIRTADLEVEVDDVTGAARRAQDAIAAVGGLLFTQETTNDPMPRTVLTFKVPPDAFVDALARLEALGAVRTQRITADDVTERVVDLRSRIITAEVSVVRLRALLERAVELEQVASLESQLLVRETHLEQLRGQLRTLEDLVDLATIHVTLEQPRAQSAMTASVTASPVIGDRGGPVRCPGTDELVVDEGDEVILCVAVVNTGTVTLADLEITDPGLGLGPGDFLVVEGDLEQPLAPGDRLVAWGRLEVTSDQSPATRVSAVPLAGPGVDDRLAVIAAVDTVALEVRPDDSLPGFTDAVAWSWRGLARLTGMVVLLVGAAIPFLWIVPAGVVLARWRHRGERPIPPPPGPAVAPTD